MREVGADGVDPTSLRGLVRDAEYFTDRKPTITGRQRQGEAGFVEMA